MTAAASTALIAELDAAVSGRSPDRRLEILRQITNLFMSDADRLNEVQIGVFDDVLVRLIESVDASALVPLSATLSEACLVPAEAVRQLAFHENASVAAPVLRNCRRLSERDLVEIANTRGQRHLLAISARQTIREPLSDPLVARGDFTVLAALAENLGARFSEAACAALTGKADRDGRLAEILASRSDFPPELHRRLAATVDNARMRFLQAASQATREKVRGTIAEATERMDVAAPESADYAKAHAKIAELNRAGKLNDSSVNRFAIAGEYENVLAALSLLLEVPIEVVVPLLEGTELDGLIVACRAARLNWSTTAMIIRNRPDCPPITEPELERGQIVFKTFSLSAAQGTIRL